MNVEVYPKRNWLTLRRSLLGVTKGGIILPDADRSYKYTVERVSEDVEMGVEPGMEVFCPGSAIECELVGADKDLFLVKESDIVAVLVRDAS
jgi:co-chaperonin GroES (HSP10)